MSANFDELIKLSRQSQDSDSLVNKLNQKLSEMTSLSQEKESSLLEIRSRLIPDADRQQYHKEFMADPTSWEIFKSSLKQSTAGVVSGIMHAPSAASRILKALPEGTSIGDTREQTIKFLDTLAQGTETIPGLEDIGKAITDMSAEKVPEYVQIRTEEIAVKADSAFDNLMQGDFRELGEVLSDYDSWVYAFGQAAPSLVIALTTGLPGIVALESGAGAINIKEFEEETGLKVTDAEATQALLQHVIINSALERLSSGAISKSLKNAISKSLTGGVKENLEKDMIRRLGESGYALAKNATGEFITEVLQEVNENTSVKFAYNPDQKIGEGVVLAGMGGFSSGGVMSTPKVGATAAVVGLEAVGKGIKKGADLTSNLRKNAKTPASVSPTEFTEAVDKNDPSIYLDKESRHYSPAKAIDVLDAAAAKEDATEETKKENAAKKQEIIDQVNKDVEENQAEIKAGEETIQRYKETLPKAEERLIERKNEGDPEKIAKVEEYLETTKAKIVELEEILDHRRKESKALLQTQEIVQKNEKRKAKDKAVTTTKEEVDDLVQSIQTPVYEESGELSTSSKETADRVVILAMASSSHMSEEVITNLVKNENNALTEDQRRYLESKLRSDSVVRKLDGDEVSNDVIHGDSSVGQKGIYTYQRNINDALLENDVETAKKELAELKNFAAEHKGKLQAIRQALRETSKERKEGSKIRGKGIEHDGDKWVVKPELFSEEERLEGRRLNVEIGKSNKLLAKINEEANALNLSFTELNNAIKLAEAGGINLGNPTSVTSTPSNRVILKPANPNNTRYLEKDQAKSDKATKFIGRGSENSSTAFYAKSWGDRANTGKYTADDVVFISAEGNRKGRVKPDFEEIQKAVDSGATIITDTPLDRERKYNVGEREIASFLLEIGYEEKKPGVWSKKKAAKKVAAKKVAAKKATKKAAKKAVTVSKPTINPEDTGGKPPADPNSNESSVVDIYTDEIGEMIRAAFKEHGEENGKFVRHKFINFTKEQLHALYELGLASHGKIFKDQFQQWQNNRDEAKTGKLSIYLQPSTHKQEYRKKNLVRDMTSQNTKKLDGITRPFVAVRNLVTSMVNGAVSFLDYLPKQESLSEEQSELFNLFVKLIPEWVNEIESDINLKSHRDMEFFRDTDFIRYFFVKKANEEGNIDYEIDENVLGAIATAAFIYVGESADDLYIKTDEQINRLIGRDETSEVTDAARALLGNVGINQNQLANRLGQSIMQILGINIQDNAYINVGPRISVDLGIRALNLLMHQGYLKNTDIPSNDIREAFGEKSDSSLEYSVQSFYRLATETDNIYSFNDDVKLLIDTVKGTKYVLQDFVGKDRPIKDPTFEPEQVTRITPNNSKQDAPSVLIDTLQTSNNEGNIVAERPWTVLTNMDTESVDNILGIDSRPDEDLHPENRMSTESRNHTLRLSFDNFYNFVTETLQDISKVFFLSHVPWSQNRSSVDTQSVNTQRDKIHRYLTIRMEWLTEVVFDNEDQMRRFLLRISEGLGISTDKGTNETSLEKLHALFEDPKIVAAMEVLHSQKYREDKALSVEESSAIVNAAMIGIGKRVGSGGDGIKGLAALTEYFEYIDAKYNHGHSSFVTSLFGEVDGVNNGPILTFLMFGIRNGFIGFEEMMKKGGFFTENSGETGFGSWISKDGNRDLYQETIYRAVTDLNSSIIETNETGEKVIERATEEKPAKTIQLDEDSLQIYNDTYESLWYFIGKLTVEDKLTKIARDLIKNPLTTMVFGANLGKAARALSDSLIDSIYEKIEASKGFPDEVQDLRWHLYNLFQAAGVDIAISDNTPIDQLMTMRFNNNDIEKLKSISYDYLGSFIQASMETQFEEYVKIRSTMNNTANAIYSLYEAAYSSARDAYIKELILKDEIAVDGRGNPLHEMTIKQERDFQKSIEGMLPLFNTLMSQESGDVTTGIRIANTKEKLNNNPMYEGEVHFNKPKTWDERVRNRKSESSSTRTRASSVLEDEPGAKMSPMGMHSVEAYIVHSVIANHVVYNNHDSLAAGIDALNDVARDLNRNTYEAMVKFSFSEEMLNALIRTIEGIVEYGDNIADQNDRNRYYASVHRAISSIKQNKSDIPSNHLYVLANKVLGIHLNSTEEKLALLAKVKYVDQFVLEEGVYEVSPEERAATQKKLEEIMNHNGELSKAHRAAIAKLKGRVDAAIKAPVVEPVANLKAAPATDGVSVDIFDQSLKETPIVALTRDQLIKIWDRYIRSSKNENIKSSSQKYLDAFVNGPKTIEAVIHEAVNKGDTNLLNMLKGMQEVFDKNGKTIFGKKIFEALPDKATKARISRGYTSSNEEGTLGPPPPKWGEAKKQLLAMFKENVAKKMQNEESLLHPKSKEWAIKIIKDLINKMDEAGRPTKFLNALLNALDKVDSVGAVLLNVRENLEGVRENLINPIADYMQNPENKEKIEAWKKESESPSGDDFRELFREGRIVHSPRIVKILQHLKDINTEPSILKDIDTLLEYLDQGMNYLDAYNKLLGITPEMGFAEKTKLRNSVKGDRFNFLINMLLIDPKSIKYSNHIGSKVDYPYILPNPRLEAFLNSSIDKNNIAKPISVKDFFNWFNKNYGKNNLHLNNFYTALLPLLDKVAQRDTQIVFLTGDVNHIDVSHIKGNIPPAWYSPSENIIYMKGPEYLDSNVSLETIFHEIIHAATYDAIASKDPAIQNQVAELEELMVKVNEYIKKNNLTHFMYDHALYNIYEFISIGMSNRAFQENVLAKVQYESKANKEKSNGFFALVQGIFDILVTKFKLKKSDAGRTALATLIMNTSAIIEATNNISRDNPTDGINNVLAFPTAVRELDSVDIFQELGKRNPESVEFTEKLTNVLEGIVGKVYGAFGNIRQTIANNAALTGEDIFNRAIKDGKLPFASSALQSQMEFTPQAAFVADQVEATVAHILRDPKIRTTGTYRELVSLYREARKQLTPEDFHDGPWDQGTNDTHNEAKEAYNFVFATEPSARGDLDYLSRFTAIGLTHKKLNDRLAQMEIVQTKAAKADNLADLLRRWVDRGLRFFTNPRGDRRLSAQANTRLHELAETLVANEVREISKFTRGLDTTMDTIEDYVNEKAKAAGNKVVKFSQSKLVEDSRVALVRAAGGITQVVAKERVGALVTAVNKVANKFKDDIPGIVLGSLNYAKGYPITLQYFNRMAKNIQKQRNDFSDAISKNVLAAFKDAGTYLTDEMKTAISYAALRTDAAALLDRYSMDEIQEFYTNSSMRKMEINRLERIIKSNKKNTYSDHMIYQGKNLAYFMVTGRSKIPNLSLNAHNIVNMAGIKGIKKPNIDSNTKLTENLDLLISLYAIEYTKPEHLSQIANIIREENNRNAGENGLEYTIRLHKELAKDSKEKLFSNEGDIRNIRKGYITDVLNTSDELFVADESQVRDMEFAGWISHGKVSNDPRDPNKDVKILMTLPEGGLVERVSSVLSTTDTGHVKGTKLRMTDPMLTADKKARSRHLHPSPDFDPRKVNTNYAIPVYDSKGNVIYHRYEMNANTKDNVLKRRNEFEHLLGEMYSGTYDKVASKDHNKSVAKMLRDMYEKDYAANPDLYIEVSPNSELAQVREAYALMPDDFKNTVRNLWGGQHLRVRKDMFEMIFGYRKYSLRNAFDEFGERNQMEKVIAKIITEMFKAYGVRIKGLSSDDAIKYSKRAGTRVRAAEKIWQELVRELKDFIVVKSGSVLVLNIISNMSVLKMRGVPLKTILKDHLVAIRGARQYERDMSELMELQFRKEMGYLQGVDAKNLDRDIAILEDAITNNPVREVIDAGLMPTIVQDISFDPDRYSYKSRFSERVESLSEKLPGPVKSVGKQALMTHDTSLYKFMAQTTQLSDFVARYTLYNHLMNRRKNPMTADEAALKASEAFVNYDVPMPRMLQYFDDMGFVMFMKYFLSIQRVLWDTIKDNPFQSGLTMATFGLLDLELVTESSAISRFGNNPLEWGPFRMFSQVDNTATMSLVKGML